jgi:fatty-acyl-CoA synthase
VPKEIIFLDKLPLTAVGKPIKHLLQVDAARRVFDAALRPVPGTWTLEVVNTGGSGLRTTLRLRGDAPGARQAAEEILSAYSTPYRIEDAAD